MVSLFSTFGLDVTSPEASSLEAGLKNIDAFNPCDLLEVRAGDLKEMDTDKDIPDWIRYLPLVYGALQGSYLF